MTIRELVAEAAQRFGVTVSELMSSTRERRVAWARQWVMTEAYHRLKYSQPQIGAALGRDHKTVHHGIHAEMKRRRESTKP